MRSAAAHDAIGYMVNDDNPRQNVTFPSNGSSAHGYLALPQSGSGPGVIVIQEWWGLTDHIAEVANRLAAEGFVALAPDLFGGRTTHDAQEAATLMRQLPVDRAVRDLSGAVDFLLGHEAVTGGTAGTVGFCMGGGFVLLLAAKQGVRIGAAVTFYGIVPGPSPEFSKLSARLQGHFGEYDEFLPPTKVREMAAAIERESGRKPEFYFYPAGHAFFNDENLLGTYAPEQAALAWRRTLEFLWAQLGATR